jgi:DNA (cytosine-5)-methyltransferase 1
MAGLKVIWGFDFNPHACQTWHQNFPDATLYEMSAYDVCLRSQEGDCLRCDILHMSPPCQYFSPAHTIAAKDDDMNSASLFACGQLLQEIKPRIVTLEQTFGINHLEFIRWFNALINMFTTNGYSLRWKICHLQEWVRHLVQIISKIFSDH